MRFLAKLGAIVLGSISLWVPLALVMAQTNSVGYGSPGPGPLPGLAPDGTNASLPAADAGLGIAPVFDITNPAYGGKGDALRGAVHYSVQGTNVNLGAVFSIFNNASTPVTCTASGGASVTISPPSVVPSLLGLAAGKMWLSIPSAGGSGGTFNNSISSVNTTNGVITTPGGAGNSGFGTFTNQACSPTVFLNDQNQQDGITGQYFGLVTVNGNQLQTTSGTSMPGGGMYDGMRVVVGTPGTNEFQYAGVITQSKNDGQTFTVSPAPTNLTSGNAYKVTWGRFLFRSDDGTTFRKLEMPMAGSGTYRYTGELAEAIGTIASVTDPLNATLTGAPASNVDRQDAYLTSGTDDWPAYKAAVTAAMTGGVNPSVSYQPPENAAFVYFPRDSLMASIAASDFAYVDYVMQAGPGHPFWPQSTEFFAHGTQSSGQRRAPSFPGSRDIVPAVHLKGLTTLVGGSTKPIIDFVGNSQINDGSNSAGFMNGLEHEICRAFREAYPDLSWGTDSCRYRGIGGTKVGMLDPNGPAAYSGTAGVPQGTLPNWYPGAGSGVTATITIASPAVVSAANTFSTQLPQPVVFTTTGALPTGITAGTRYYTIPSTVTTSQFQIATSIANAMAGTAITTTGTQSGTQTVTPNAALWLTEVVEADAPHVIVMLFTNTDGNSENVGSWLNVVKTTQITAWNTATGHYPDLIMATDGWQPGAWGQGDNMFAASWERSFAKCGANCYTMGTAGAAIGLLDFGRMANIVIDGFDPEDVPMRREEAVLSVFGNQPGLPYTTNHARSGWTVPFYLGTLNSGEDTSVAAYWNALQELRFTISGGANATPSADPSIGGASVGYPGILRISRDASAKLAVQYDSVYLSVPTGSGCSGAGTTITCTAAVATQAHELMSVTVKGGGSTACPYDLGGPSITTCQSTTITAGGVSSNGKVLTVANSLTATGANAPLIIYRTTIPKTVTTIPSDVMVGNCSFTLNVAVQLWFQIEVKGSKMVFDYCYPGGSGTNSTDAFIERMDTPFRFKISSAADDNAGNSNSRLQLQGPSYTSLGAVSTVYGADPNFASYLPSSRIVPDTYGPCGVNSGAFGTVPYGDYGYYGGQCANHRGNLGALAIEQPVLNSLRLR